MVRKQVYITPEQDRKLKQAADQLGTTEAQVVRHGIDLATRETELSREQAWREVLAFMRERAKLKVPYNPRTWTRDELYDD